MLGFGGLDVLAIYLAFKLNYRAARAYEEVAVSRTEIVVRKVTRRSGRAQEFRFNPQWVRLEVEQLEDEGVVRIALRARDRPRAGRRLPQSGRPQELRARLRRGARDRARLERPQ